MLLADINDLMWAKELPHKELIMTALYNVPGAIMVGCACVILRMMIEELLGHISQKLARLRLWSWLCVIVWLVTLKTTHVSDSFARLIHWDQIVSAPSARAAGAGE